MKNYLLLGLLLASTLTLSGQTSMEVLVNEETTISALDSLNTVGSEFGPSLYASGLLYTSSEGPSRATDELLGRPVYRLWTATRTDETVDDPSLYSTDLTSFLHEGPAEFTTDDQALFVTRNWRAKNLAKYRKKNKIKLSVYERAAGSSQLTLLPFNSKKYSSCHPTYWEDMSTLIFASDRPGGYGGMDLYKVIRTDDGWSEPENLGAQVNTSFNEVFPFMHDSGLLNYSSDRVVGQGLDLFYSTVNEENIWAKARSYPQGYNTPEDDFSLVFTEDLRTGYFASAREGGHGSDDLYKVTASTNRLINFMLPEEVISTTTTTTETSTGTDAMGAYKREVTVIDQTTGRELEDVRVYALELDGDDSFLNKDLYETRFIPTQSGELLMKISKKIGSPGDNLYSLTDQMGHYTLSSDDKKRYVMIFYKNGYEPLESVMSLGDFTDAVTIPLLEESCISTEALVRDASTGQSIENARIVIDDACKSIPSEFLTDDLGYGVVCITENCRKDVYIEARGYERLYFALNEGESWPVGNVFRLTPRGAGTSYGGANNSTGTSGSLSAGTVIVLEDIYYEFNKAEIASGAAQELEVLAQLMKQYPRLEIQLRSHTDSRGRDDYNLKLSYERALSAQRYLVRRGVESSRITVRGLGELEIRNQCTEGVNCTDAEHRYNRRTEVVVTQADPSLIIQQ